MERLLQEEGDVLTRSLEGGGDFNGNPPEFFNRLAAEVDQDNNMMALDDDEEEEEDEEDEEEEGDEDDEECSNGTPGDEDRSNNSHLIEEWLSGTKSLSPAN